ncbi:hypothetical protein [Alicyclobacillus sp. SP_1]|uniref:hypothetical protein n=1 Tax=Alicyclobacillus sp. SP_1 TaxID=2942475 RepID=UPI00215722BE|nr:hypothetical protein [Alicyclobacillus sp. SP_1]
MMTLLSDALEAFWYLIALAGLLWLFSTLRSDVAERLRRLYYGFGHREWMRVHAGFQRLKTPAETRTSRVYRIHDHLETLVHTVRKRPKPPVVQRFLVTSGALGGCAGVFGFAGVHRVGFALFFGLCVSVVPYLWLLVRRYQIGVQNSYDMRLLLDTLLAEYRKHHHSMQHALEATVAALPDRPMRRTLRRLAERTANFTTPSDVRRVIQQFADEMATTWAVQLANDFEHALLDGLDVEVSLQMTRKELQFFEDTRKDEKWVSSDNLLIGIVPFLMWPLVVLLLQLKLSHHILAYQFDTAQGFRWLVLTALMTLTSFFVGLIFYRPKQEV